MLLLGRICITLLIFQTLCDDKVPFEVGRAGYFTSELDVAHGKNTINCFGDREIADRIYWSKNGVRVDAEFTDIDTRPTVASTHIFVNTEEAVYHCNGLYVYMIKNQPEIAAQRAFKWRNSTITCIDKIANEETYTLEKMDGPYKTTIELFHYWSDRVVDKQAFYPVKDRKITEKMTIKCNNTESFTFFTIGDTKSEAQYREVDLQ